MRKKRKSSFQITVRRIGKKYLVCIGGTPKKMCDSLTNAEMVADNYRVKYGKRPKRKK